MIHQIYRFVQSFIKQSVFFNSPVHIFTWKVGLFSDTGKMSNFVTLSKYNCLPIFPEFTMAIRARIKSKIKSILFGSSTTSSNNASSNSVNQTSTTVSKTTFVTPSVSTAASQSDTSTTEPPSTVDTADKQTLTPPTVETPASASEEKIETDTVEPSSADEQSHVDDSEASFVFEVEELFPETCPHCGASSHNNWIRIENKFACGSCEAAY